MDASKNHNSMQDELTKIVCNLHGLFDEIGLSASAREGREASVYSALNTVLQKQLGLVAEEKDHLKEECRKLIASIRQMEQSLDDNKSGRRNSIEDRVTTPLLKCLRGLKERHENVKKRHSERYDAIKELAQALEQYASRLEPSIIQIALPPAIDDPAVTTPLDLSQSYHERLEAEFNYVYQEFTKRSAMVQSISKEIIDLYNELGSSKTHVDRNIVEFGTSQPERLGLLKDDIERLKGKRDKLLGEKEQRNAQVEDLKIEIGELWQKLGVEPQEQKAFLARHRGFDLKTIRELEKELDRLLELKQENLHVWVSDAREVLSELWEKLYFSAEEISYFSPAHSDVMSDALLSAHEIEIQRLQDLFSERAPIISLIDKHRSLVDDRKALTASANDSSRLISRGGGGNRDPTRLLREEKMRKRIAKDLPKVELELRKELEKWEDEYGEPFLVKGEDYLQALMGSSVVCQSRAGRRTPAPTPGRARSNTAGATPHTLSRPATSGKPSVAPAARPKTPTAQPLRSKTPTERGTLAHGHSHSHSLSSTVGKLGGRSLAMVSSREDIALYKSGAKTPGPGSRIGLSNSVSANNVSNIHRSPSKSSLKESKMPEGNQSIKNGVQTIGRFSSIKRRTAPLSSIMGPPKMQPLSRPSSKDAQGDRAMSVLSIRSVSPEERNYDDKDDKHVMPRQQRQYAQPHQKAGYNTQREVSEDSTYSSIASRKLSVTSSATLTSGSGSENWEIFGADSEFGDADEERMDPMEGYYRSNIVGETKGGRGGGGIVMVRNEDEWDGQDECF